MKKIAFLLTAMFAFLCQVSFSQGSTSTASSQSSAATGADVATVEFINNATIANLKEVATGKLAAKKGKDLSIKAYGGKMVDHHTMATKQMAELLKTKKIKVSKPPMEAAAPDSAMITATGADFDRLYVAAMIADHKKTIALFEDASTNLPDPDLKAFAVKTLPMLKEHLAEIQTIAANLNYSTQ